MTETALLLLHLQNEIVERYGAGSGPLLPTLARAAAEARAAPLQVIHVRVAFRPGAPEISARNRLFAAIAARQDAGLDDDATQVHPALGPAPEDVVVVNKRVSAFAGGDLEVVLRSREVGRLVLAGIATSGTVLSTLRQAADLDYELVVLRDGCADADAEVHRVLLEKVFPRQAEVLDTEEWLAGLSAAEAG